jgi:FAD/FMN-containing dehydrogenase
MVDSHGELQLLIGEELKERIHSFGLLGVITKIQLRIVPEYSVRKSVFQNVPWGCMLRS